MDDLTVSTVVRRPPEDVYEFLFDFTRYSQYSEYVDEVRVRGQGEGTRFEIALSWWRLSYAIRGVVTGVDPPNRIEWEVTRDVDARGHWAVEPVDRGGLGVDGSRGTSPDGTDGVADDAGIDGGTGANDETGNGGEPTADGFAGASVARLYVEYDPGSIGRSTLGLPPFVSLSGIVDRIRPVARREAERIAARAVEDVEGRSRPVDVRIETRPDAF